MPNELPWQEFSARSVDEAIELGLRTLRVQRDDVEIEALDNGSRGFLGIGSRPARVQLRLLDNPPLRAQRFLEEVLGAMGVASSVVVEDNEERMEIRMEGDQSGILIGRRGETLDALQYLTSLVVNKGNAGYHRVMLDTENYRQKREDTLTALARRMADRARRSGQPVEMEPMNPYERRILHSALQNNPYVETHSEGEEPNRHVVIVAKGR